MKPVSRQGLMVATVAWFAGQPDAASCSALGRSEGRSKEGSNTYIHKFTLTYVATPTNNMSSEIITQVNMSFEAQI